MPNFLSRFWRRDRAITPTSKSTPAFPFHYCIDAPTGEAVVTSPYVRVSGWVVAESQPTAMEFCGDGQVVATLTKGRRTDVEAAYPGQSATGWTGLFPVAELPQADNWTVCVELAGHRWQIPLSLRLDRDRIQQFWRDKQAKLAKIREILQCPLCGSDRLQETGDRLVCQDCTAAFPVGDRGYNFLPPSLIEYGRVKDTANVSANRYDPTALEFIQKHASGLILDNGCGLREIYYQNVVNLEIVDHPTTDVLGIGEKLPFRSDSFDAIFSLAVLEHVKAPFECASEIVRVLKPGGTLYAVVPFLQPFHGYPDHYYNMTSSGLKNLFGDHLSVVEAGVPQSGLPIWSLTWFLNSYLQGLPEPIAREFKNMKVSDLLDNPLVYLQQDFVNRLSDSTNEELASTNYILAVKPKPQT